MNFDSVFELPHHHPLLFDDAASHVFTLDAAGADTNDMAFDDDGHFRHDSLNMIAISPLSDSKWEPHRSRPVDIGRRALFAPLNPFGDSCSQPASASAPSSSSALFPATATGWQLEHTSNTASPLMFDPHHNSEDCLESTGIVSRLPGQVASSLPSDHAGLIDGKLNETHLSHYNMRTDSLCSDISPRSDPDMFDTAPGSVQSLPRHMRANSKSVRPTTTIRSASDGIRKKNARIDIPADRTLDNIEELIELAHDEDEVRELKAQRRLLRNREAALASRQRKKQHTEDLEVKEQRYLKQMNGLRHEFTDMSQQHSQLELDYRILHQKHGEACHMINAFDMEKEELILKHTQDTSVLRRRIQYLTQRLGIPNEHESMTSTNNNCNDFTSDANDLAVAANAWPSSTMIHDAHEKQNTHHYTIDVEQPRAATASMRPEHSQPVASGVLFMILLCGAWAASNATNKMSLPQMPEEVRMASDTVLNLLKDTHTMTGETPSNLQHVVQLSDALQGHRQMQADWQSTAAVAEGEALYKTLTMPTSRQEADQLFALTPSEYHSFTSSDRYLPQQPQSTTIPHRALAGSLTTMKDEHMSSALLAETYTRSLLWEQVPLEAIKHFKALVGQNNLTEGTEGTTTPSQLVFKTDYDHSSVGWSYGTL